MITQRVKLDVNNQQGPTIYARMGEKNLRQIVFILTRKDEESGEDVVVDIPAGAAGQLRILKPSNNFVIVDLVKTTLESGSTIFTATLPEQAVTVGGLCYYDVRIEETTSKFIFSATGHMVVDDSVISSGVLEDVSEVNGLVFPDDFLTKEDGAAVIDDTTTSTDSTWSSQKISNEINAIDLTNYATKQYVDSAISGVSAGITYSTTPVETGLFNGKKVYTVMSNNFSVTSTSNSNWVTRILNPPSLSKLLSVKLIANYLDGDYTAMVFPVGAFYNARSNFIEMSGSIQSGWDSITFEMAIIEYVEV